MRSSTIVDVLKKMKKDILHVGISVCVAIFFVFFFQQDWVPEWIRHNIQLVPNGQIVAYSVIGAVWLFIFTTKILRKPPQKPELTFSNILYELETILKMYSTMFIDFVSATVIAYTFFNVGFELGSDSVIDLATICSIFVFPPLALYISWVLSRQKIAYVAPIFANRSRKFSFK